MAKYYKPMTAAIPPRRPSRVAQKHARARREILQVARDILREQGGEALTLAAMAARLGMTKQALYHYFASKEALDRALVTALLDDEIEFLLAAIAAADSPQQTLRALIRGFHAHYADRLYEFRTVYCQSQLYTSGKPGLDSATLRDEINPRTQRLFDVLEKRLAPGNANRQARQRARRLAFTAWTSALGIVTMLSVADAAQDPLRHTDAELLETLCGVYEKAVLSLK